MTAPCHPRAHLRADVAERFELEILEAELLELEQAEGSHAARVPTLEELGEPAPHDPRLMGSSSLPRLIAAAVARMAIGPRVVAGLWVLFA